MNLNRLFSKAGHLIAKRVVLLIVIIALITTVMAYGITRIEVKTSVDMLLSKDDPVAVHNTQFQQEFGGESLVLLIRGDQESLFAEDSLQQLNSLQQALASTDRVYSVTSPVSLAGVFAEQAQKQSQEIQKQIGLQIEQAMKQARETSMANGGNADQQARAAAEAKAQAEQQIQEQYGQQIEKMKQVGELSASNEQFVRYALFDDKGAPKAAVAHLLPENGNDVLFSIQLEPGLNMQEMSATTAQLKQIIAAHPIENVEPLFGGIPAISKALEDSIAEDIGVMLVTVIILMIIVLAVIFPVRWRLISLPVVLVGMIWTFGLMGYLGLPLSIATMALLPILIGLGTDFALQFHNRYEEELVKTEDSKLAIVHTVRHMGPAVGIAVGIMAVGFLTLLLSDMPMIKDFGAMLAVGVIIMYTLGLFLLLPILSWRDRKGYRMKQRKSGNVVEGLLSRLGKIVIKRPAALLIIPVLLAAAGFSLDHKLNVESNIEKLMPQDAPELIEMNKIREVLGSTLTIDWMVQADDVTRPEVIGWMEQFERETVEQYPEITAGSSIVSVLHAVQPDLANADHAAIQAILEQLPSEMTAPFLSQDRHMGRITLTLNNIDSKAQEKLLEELEQKMDAPNGVSVNPVGIQLMQVKSLNGLTDSRHTSLISGLFAIVIGLCIVYRNLKRAFFPILPIVLVNGWSAGLLFVLGTDINPLTAVLGALVLGIGTEFTILLMERYLEEKEKGFETKEAIVTAITKVGRAISASGLTVMDTLLCLLSTLIVLPAIIVLLDKEKVTVNLQKGA